MLGDVCFLVERGHVDAFDYDWSRYVAAKEHAKFVIDARIKAAQGK